MDIDVLMAAGLQLPIAKKSDMNDLITTFPYVSNCSDLRHTKTCVCFRLVNLITTRVQKSVVYY